MPRLRLAAITRPLYLTIWQMVLFMGNRKNPAYPITPATRAKACKRPFFLCYIEFDLYFSFASVHAIAPFRFEGLGHFPTSNFQPTHRRAGGRKYGKGYSFPMLAKKVFSLLITTTKLPVCQKRAKEKRRNPATLQSLYADKNEGTLFPRPVVVGFLYAFCSSRHDF